MSKNVLILSSTPRRGGNSDVLCDEFLRGAREAGHRVEKIFLKDKKIGYCTACGSCYNAGKPCPQQDDADEIVGKMIAADVIVMATPIYFYTMCAQLKVLIDRTCARYTEISGKEFYFIATAADGEQRNLERTIGGLRGFTACLDDATERGVIYGAGAWQIGDIAGKPAMTEAYEAGRTV